MDCCAGLVARIEEPFVQVTFRITNQVVVHDI